MRKVHEHGATFDKCHICEPTEPTPPLLSAFYSFFVYALVGLNVGQKNAGGPVDTRVELYRQYDAANLRTRTKVVPTLRPELGGFLNFDLRKCCWPASAIADTEPETCTAKIDILNKQS